MESRNRNQLALLLGAALCAVAAMLLFSHDPPVTEPRGGTEPPSVEQAPSAARATPARSEAGEAGSVESRRPRETSAERLRRAREQSGLGVLSEAELRDLVASLRGLEKNMAENRDGYLSSGGTADTLEFLDLTFDLEGAVAKTKALLDGSYVLMPVGKSLAQEIVGDSRLHVVVGPGGVRDGVAFQTHIVIDLEKQGRFAQAMTELARARERK